MVTVIAVTHGSCCVLLMDGWMSDGRERWESCGVASVSHHVAPCRGHVAGMSGREHVAGMSPHSFLLDHTFRHPLVHLDRLLAPGCHPHRQPNPTTSRQSDNGSDNPTTVPTFRHSDKWTSVVTRTKPVRQKRESDKCPTTPDIRRSDNARQVPDNPTKRPTLRQFRQTGLWVF